jgi:hypothetical protein
VRDKDYNTGLRGVLFEARHHARMGAAVWLFGWLVLRQTFQSGPVGWVLGGKPISYREIEEETGFNRRTLENWMRLLRRHGYVETETAQGGVIIRIMKAKKFAQAPRNSAGGVRNHAGGAPQSCVGNGSKRFSHQQLAAGIGSSSVVGEKERATATPSCLEENQNQQQHEAQQHPTGNSQQPLHFEPRRRPGDSKFPEILRRALLRADREDAIRRELAVGSGPEVRRS